MSVLASSSAGAGRTPPLIPEYELLRPIGRGAYGEVWLARSVLGTMRAIKIVYRAAFEHRRPYEREFEGIKRCEPISRTHESQVAILHVGRDEEDRYYYYVMELADDCAGAAADWASYTPRTLQTELKGRGKLPLGECVQLALALGTALQHLHRNGLIHRDVKLGNVIFVNGRPKLADIGLVAEKDSTVSFVGTHGYFPPEGPGTEQADIYSLGKVLYELSTGKDRNDFPELPVENSTLREELLEFNEVLLRACHNDSRQRYHSTAQFLSDLDLLQRGRSVRSRRSRERWRALAQKCSLAAASLVLTAAGGFLLAAKPSALNIEPFPLSIREQELWQSPHQARRFDFTAGTELRWVGRSGDGVSIWDRSTGVSRSLDLQLPSGWRIHPSKGCVRWAPDGKKFAFQAYRDAGGSNFWTLFMAEADSGKCTELQVRADQTLRVDDLCWRRDGEALTCLFAGGQLLTVRLNGEHTLWPRMDLPRDWGQLLGGYSPDGNWLLTCLRDEAGQRNNSDDRDVWILPHLGNGAPVRLIRQNGFDGYPAWEPDGKSVVFVSEGGQWRQGASSIYRVKIDPRTLLPLGSAERIFGKPGQKIVHPLFVSAGRQLVFGVERRDTRIWSANADRIDAPSEVVVGSQPRVSPDGQTIYFVGETPNQAGIFAVNRSGSEPPRLISSFPPLETESTWPSYDLSPDGTQLAFFGHDSTHAAGAGVFVVQILPQKRPVLFAEVDARERVAPVWSPDGQWIAYAAGPTLFRLSRDGAVRDSLGSLHRWNGWSLRWSPDGKWIAGLGEQREGEGSAVFAYSLGERRFARLTPPGESNLKEGLEWHPDGQRLTYFYYGPKEFDAKIRWAYLDGRPTEELIDQPDHWDYAGVWSPDGQKFYFHSTGMHPGVPCAAGETTLHEYDLNGGTIRHGLRAGSLPVWNRRGATVAWSQPDTIRHFELVENHR